MQDMPSDMLPWPEYLCGNLNRVYAMIMGGHFAFTAPDMRMVTSDFVPTILGETQAPRGEWQPSMTLLGLIPHLDDVVAALDASVSRDIRDL